VCNVIWKVSQPGATPVAVAGNGIAGYSGDGGPATSASLNQPRGVAVDPYGNLFIADYANNVIRKVTGNVITTIAGDGFPGLSGDGGPALNASFTGPWGIAVGPGGVIYVGDQTDNNDPNTRIRQLTPPGSQIISPTPGSVLPVDVTFSWTSTPAATSYQLDVSDRLGAIGQGDIFTGQTSATSLAVSNLPCDGRTIYVQLATQINGTWQQVGPYVYTACRMVTLTASPSSLSHGGGSVTLTVIVENFSPAVEAVQLKVTESLYPQLPICHWNFGTGSYTCTFPPPTVIDMTSLTLIPGVPQTLPSFIVPIAGLPANYQYGRTFVFAATVTSSTGAVLGSATVNVTQN
jgi:hypothetical protein